MQRSRTGEELSSVVVVRSFGMAQWSVNVYLVWCVLLGEAR